MRLTGAGYSEHQYNHSQILRAAKDGLIAYDAMMATRDKHGANFIAVTGKSGMSVAFAMMALRQINLMVVRKDGEDSHGSQLEGTSGEDVGNVMLLDDFVGSGHTVRTVQRTLNRKSDAKIVGVISYDRNPGTYGDLPSVDLGESSNHRRVPIFQVKDCKAYLPDLADHMRRRVDTILR